MDDKKTEENKYCVVDIEKSSKIEPGGECATVSAIEKKIKQHIVNPQAEHIIITEQAFDKRSIEYKGYMIPEVSQITSSPEIVLGPETLSMVDEFMREEKRQEEERKKGFFKKFTNFFACCK